MIIAGDIGGTKTHLALFDQNYEPQHLRTYHSPEYAHFEEILEKYLAELSFLPQKGAFAIAGPVVDGVCRTTNLPWIVDSYQLAEKFKIAQVGLINDLEANAWSVAILEPNSFSQIIKGTGKGKGNRAVISPGTGLGEAGIYWDGKTYYPFASEGGHADFAPRNDLQMALCNYLILKYGHASYERILSGPGLVNVYTFLRDDQKRIEPSWLTEALAHDDQAKVISEHALNGQSDICAQALDLFIDILAAEAGNTALKFLATGGVYLGGGIPPKIVSKLKEPSFQQNFLDKGKMRHLLETISIDVIMDDKASLKGAAFYAQFRLLIHS